MRIAVDAMGTDHCPAPDVEGSVHAARETGDTLILVGPADRVRQEVNKYDVREGTIEIVHAEQVIRMDDKPSVVGRDKPQSSMHVGMNLVKDGKAEAFVSMGNTGAAFAIAMLYTLKRIPGVKRPALSAVFPILGRQVVFLDVGANADAKSEWLVQFAVMGDIYARRVLGVQTPRVGLLSNGEEEGKGNQLVQDAGTAIAQLPVNFIGNVEPSEILQAHADVVLSDGFTGNILLKTFEASMRYINGLIREELMSSPVSAAGGFLSKSAFTRVRRRVDTGEIGGAPLLGVNGVVLIGHGSSDAKAVKNAIIQARKSVEGRVIDTIRQDLSKLSSEQER